MKPPRNAFTKGSAAPSNAMVKKKTAWYDPALDFAFTRMDAKKHSLPARTLLETVQGNKSDITEKNFTPEQLQTIADLVRIAGPGNPVRYDTYGKLYRERQAKTGKIPLDIAPGLSSMSNDIGQIQTTLGQFNVVETPEGIRIVDNYDFSSNGWGPEISTFGGPYGLIRSYAGRKIPPGQGRKVNVFMKAKK
jgi:hypothetical protein